MNVVPGYVNTLYTPKRVLCQTVHNAAFHQGLHCLLISKQHSRTEIHHNLETLLPPLKVHNRQSNIYCINIYGKMVRIHRVNIYKQTLTSHGVLNFRVCPDNLKIYSFAMREATESNTHQHVFCFLFYG